MIPYITANTSMCVAVLLRSSISGLRKWWLLANRWWLPGQGGQLPHLDYPYYRTFYPASNPNIMDTAPPLSVQFVTLVTDFR